MTATERLRELLDERGVEWDGESYEKCTFWNEETNMAVASEGRDGKLWVSQNLTPEQAIAATLGAGTCNISVNDNLAETEGMGDVWLECDACGWQMSLEPSTPRFNFCPNCGRKVVDG